MYSLTEVGSHIWGGYSVSDLSWGGGDLVGWGSFDGGGGGGALSGGDLNGGGRGAGGDLSGGWGLATLASDCQL